MLPAISDPESVTPIPSSGSTTETDSIRSFDRRRRAVLEYLADRAHDGPVSLTDLADHLTLAERDADTGPIAGCGDALLGTRRRIRISLRHRHIPKLAAADAVDFDIEANTVSLRDAGSRLLERSIALERAAAREPTAQ